MPSKPVFHPDDKSDIALHVAGNDHLHPQPMGYYSFTDEQFQMVMEQLGVKSGSSGGIGNPGPLGLAAFALTTFVLSVFNAGSNLIDVHLEAMVLPLALFYGGMIQFAAGMWEYRANNTFGATAFSSYGAFWMSFAGYVYLIVPKIEATHKVKKATGLFLLAWFIFTLYMTVAAWRVSKALFAVFVVLDFTFLFLIVGNLGDISIVTNIGGWLGIITALLAWYCSAAGLINAAYKRTLLPVGPYKED